MTVSVRLTGNGKPIIVIWASNAYQSSVPPGYSAAFSASSPPSVGAVSLNAYSRCSASQAPGATAGVL